MNITLIGTGNMGSALARQLTRAGHAVRITARDLAKAQALAAANPGAVAVAPADALTGSDVVIVATGYADAVPALSAERDALWARIGAADFLDRDEKRATIGYGPAAPST